MSETHCSSFLNGLVQQQVFEFPYSTPLETVVSPQAGILEDQLDVVVFLDVGMGFGDGHGRLNDHSRLFF